MTIELFLGLLLGASTLSSLITEKVKKVLTKIDSNIIAGVIGLLVGFVGMVFYYLIVCGDINWLFTSLMGIMCPITSMVGYDKIKAIIIGFITK